MSGNAHADRVERAALALTGVAVGDGFGQRFIELTGPSLDLIEQRTLPRPPWPFTDDTVMALAIVEVLAYHGQIEQDALAHAFAAKYAAEPNRGYGPGAYRLLSRLATGARAWRIPFTISGVGNARPSDR